LSDGLDHTFPEARDFQYCPSCGQKLVEGDIDGRTRLHCPSCQYIWYKNPVPAAGAIIFRDDKLLLVKRKYEPRAGDWCLPAGFQEYDESPLECCIREVKEETGLEIKIDRLFWNYKAGDDPRTMVVLILYLADIVDGVLEPGDDAVEAKFFPLSEIPSNIAFKAHRMAISHLKNFLSRGELPLSD